MNILQLLNRIDLCLVFIILFMQSCNLDLSHMFRSCEKMSLCALIIMSKIENNNFLPLAFCLFSVSSNSVSFPLQNVTIQEVDDSPWVERGSMDSQRKRLKNVYSA